MLLPELHVPEAAALTPTPTTSLALRGESPLACVSVSVAAPTTLSAVEEAWHGDATKEASRENKRRGCSDVPL